MPPANSARSAEKPKSAPVAPERMIRAKQILARYPMARSTLAKWVDEGKFPKPVKINGLTFWNEAVVEAFFAKSSAA